MGAHCALCVVCCAVPSTTFFLPHNRKTSAKKMSPSNRLAMTAKGGRLAFAVLFGCFWPLVVLCISPMQLTGIKKDTRDVFVVLRVLYIG